MVSTENVCYRVVQLGGPMFGLGETPEAAIEDARRWCEDLDEEQIVEYAHAHHDGQMVVQPISERLYRELVDHPGREPKEHWCDLRGLADLGSEEDCEWHGTDRLPEELECDRRRTVLQSEIDALWREEVTLNRRMAEIAAQRKRIQEEGAADAETAGRAWREVMREIEYAYSSHREHVMHNIKPADRERLIEPTPANVLETARRRHYAPEWFTLMHMVRAIREIEEACRVRAAKRMA